MQIPPLAPDLRFPRLQQTAEHFTFSFDVKRAAMERYVRQRWGWDDQYQRAVHARNFEDKPFFAIEREGRLVGTVSLWKKEGFVRFGEFYLLPAEQGNGLGSRVLEHCLQAADRTMLPTRLEYLKWNPVGSLYRRHGFTVTSETDVHCHMERAAQSPR